MPKKSQFRKELDEFAEKTFQKFVENKENEMGKMSAFRNAAYGIYDSLSYPQKQHLFLQGIENRYVFCRIIAHECKAKYPPRKRRTVAKSIINNLITRAAEVKNSKKLREEEDEMDRLYNLWADQGIGHNPYARQS